jgi:hypothetical protein
MSGSKNCVVLTGIRLIALQVARSTRFIGATAFAVLLALGSAAPASAAIASTADSYAATRYPIVLVPGLTGTDRTSRECRTSSRAGSHISFCTTSVTMSANSEPRCGVPIVE